MGDGGVPGSAPVEFLLKKQPKAGGPGHAFSYRGYVCFHPAILAIVVRPYNTPRGEAGAAGTPHSDIFDIPASRHYSVPSSKKRAPESRGRPMLNSDPTNSPTTSPTTARLKVLALLFLLTNITYVDRLCISAAAPAITIAFDLSPSQIGYIFSAFTLAYSAFEIPSGWLGDYFGTRKALTRIVLWWSVFTALTGAVSGFTSLFLVRFFFGAGEAGAFPNIARTVSRWFPSSHQGRALSVAFIGNAVGAAITTPLVFKLVEWQGWRLPFLEFGGLGVAWAVVWYWWFRDRPEDHQSVNAKELEIIRSDRADGAELGHTRHVPWRILLRSSNLAFICAMYFAFGYALYFYITWLPTYLLKARGFSAAYAGFFSALPWAASAGGFWLGGLLTDWLSRRSGSLKIGRCGIGAFGLLISALALVAVVRTEDRVIAASLIAVAAFFQMLTGSAAWSVCLDVGRRNAGVVTGCMNMVGNLGGTIAPVVVGYAVERRGSWDIPFYVTAGVLAFGVMMWMLIDPRRSVIEVG
jgi:MFS transporter, ACS family, glucarate transporter